MLHLRLLKLTMATYNNCPELELDPTGLQGTADEAQAERARIRTGSLKGLGRLLLFSSVKSALDPDNFSHVAIAELEEAPLDVIAERRMNFGQRFQERVIRYRRGPLKKWDSCIFGRAETGNRIATRLLQSPYKALI